ncbi:putative ABC transporter ATP-binding protein YhcH [Paraliobacillus quinghaiensis]|uniref:ABC transporter ATP-binding protein YhcH n=1 Tax=Paraliobacillus quinghaiensis TaxID=470815 RepID=A0A917WVX5_9BACI|nr:ABC transporter ATP-binding protein [Paraliobacillus quinghaiensis]GGM33850.1 putative ABC transporter ATP-binding protein YhcH [Paraliobacillus quinghaiensis]
MTKPAMQLTDLNKTIGKKQIIKDLSFSIYPGEVFGFLGPNGAGKTTTIRMMVGLMKITSGEVLIQGKSIRTNFKEAIKEVGAIVENPEMYPFMSGWKNLVHYARMIPGISEDRIKEVIRLVGLEKVIKEKVGRYSLGMRQRLGIAQALLHNPSILILDEPTNGLDPSGIKEIRHYIRKLAEEENVAVIVSSHLLAEMELMCDRIGIIKNGELISINEVDEESDQQEMQEVHLVAEPLENAKEIIESEQDIEVRVDKDMLIFSVNRAQIPAIIKRLATEEVDIFYVQAHRTNLEDKFMALIGENAIE